MQNLIIIFLLMFSLGCSCSSSNVKSTNEETRNDPPIENVKTEKDGVKQGEMKEVVSKPAMVDNIKIYIKESFPMQVDVYASGNLPDGCTKITDVQKVREGDIFKATIMTERPAHATCTQALVPFEHSFELDVMGLKAGTYTVNVNGVRETFTMPIDNELPSEN